MKSRVVVIVVLLCLSGCSQFTRAKSVGTTFQSIHGVSLGNEALRFDLGAGVEHKSLFQETTPLSTLGVSCKLDNVTLMWWVDILLKGKPEDTHFTCAEVRW